MRNQRRNKGKAVVQTCFNVTTFFLSLSELSLCRFSSSAKEGGVLDIFRSFAFENQCLDECFVSWNHHDGKSLTNFAGESLHFFFSFI